MTIKRTFLLAILMVFGFLIFRASAQEDVYMKIQSGGFQPIAISIPPFISQQPTDLTQKIRAVIINDLKLSGFFRVVDEVPGVQASGQTAGLGGALPASSAAAVRLLGTLGINGNELQLSADLEELPGQQAIFRKKFQSAFGSFRWLAHQAADEVVYYLIGERGVASSRIAFTSGKSGVKEISVMDYDANDLEKLTNMNSLNLSPAWSPDGKRIAFTSYKSGTPELVSMDISSGAMTSLWKQGGLPTAPCWSPDGKKIAFTLTRDGNADIYIMDSGGGHLRRLTSGPSIDSSPSWSPTGNEIAFTSDRSGNPQVYLMDAEGGNVRRLTYLGNYNDSPAWSPRGDRIAYVSREEGGFQIYTVEVTGENTTALTNGEGSNENPSWSPDGLKVVFASNRTGKWDIYVMNWDGSHLRQLTDSGNHFSPKWSPRLSIK
ncbi:MAG: Tol-Pal system beta propeller repeat protein TolB [Calditrichia bacterium]